MSLLPVDPSLLAFYVGFWYAMAVAWSPFLAAGSVKRLVAGWPTDRTLVNYVLGMGGFTMVHVVAVGGAIVVSGGANLMGFLRLTVGVTVGLLAVAWVGVGFGLPGLDRWDPRAGGYDGRIVLAAGAVWYLVWTAVAVVVINMVAFAFAFPG